MAQSGQKFLRYVVKSFRLECSGNPGTHSYENLITILQRWFSRLLRFFHCYHRHLEVPGQGQPIPSLCSPLSNSFTVPGYIIGKYPANGGGGEHSNQTKIVRSVQVTWDLNQCKWMHGADERLDIRIVGNQFMGCSATLKLSFPLPSEFHEISLEPWPVFFFFFVLSMKKSKEKRAGNTHDNPPWHHFDYQTLCESPQRPLHFSDPGSNPCLAVFLNFVLLLYASRWKDFMCWSSISTRDYRYSSRYALIFCLEMFLSPLISRSLRHLKMYTMTAPGQTLLLPVTVSRASIIDISIDCEVRGPPPTEEPVN